jgi:hypothetical protein
MGTLVRDSREDQGATPIEEQIMKLKNQTRPRLPVQDYSHAIRNAVSWLGDRYLLAASLDARSINHEPLHFFSEGRGWRERISERH